MNQQRRLVVIDDDPEARDRIASVLGQSRPGSAVVLLEDATNLSDVRANDLVLLDYRLRDGSAPADTVRLLYEQDATVLIITTGASRSALEECLKAGAAGVLLKSEIESLPSALDDAERAGLVPNMTTGDALGRLAIALPDRDRRLVQYLAQGLTYEEAAPLAGVGGRRVDVLRAMRARLDECTQGWPAKLRIAIVDDHPATAAGVEVLILTCIAGAMVIKELSVDALLGTGLACDVVVLDILLGDESSPADNVRRLQDSGARVMLLTSVEPSRQADIDRVVRALDAGALSVVVKSQAEREFLEALRRVLEGNVHVNPAWARARQERARACALLTSRELEVFEKRRQGLSRAEIAEALFVSEETVKSHLRSIASKVPRFS